MSDQARPSIIIIGGGIAGLSTAYAILARRPHWRVTVLEQGERAGLGASWANSAMIHPSQAWPWPEAGSEARSGALCETIARDSYVLARRSSEILRDHFDHFDLPHRHRKSGCVKVFESRAALETELPHYEALADLGLRYALWDSAAFATAMGLPHPYGYRALHFPDDHSGPPRLYCAALIEAITERGGLIRCMSEAAAIEGKTVRVEDESLTADHIVICAGEGAARLLDIDGLMGLRGYSRTYHVPGLGASLPPVPIMDDAAHLSVTPLGDHLRISGGAHEPGAPPGDIYERFERFAFALLPHLKGALSLAPRNDWTAVRPMSARGPLIGYNAAHDVWLNTGHGHMGWTLSAGAGEAITRQLTA